MTRREEKEALKHDTAKDKVLQTLRGQTAPESNTLPQLFQVALVNVQGLKSHSAALTAHLRLLPRKPDLVCVTETHLDKAREEPKVEDYDLVARRDRVGKGGGGVCVFALKALSK